MLRPLGSTEVPRGATAAQRGPLTGRPCAPLEGFALRHQDRPCVAVPKQLPNEAFGLPGSGRERRAMPVEVDAVTEVCSLVPQQLTGVFRGDSCPWMNGLDCMSCSFNRNADHALTRWISGQPGAKNR